jgi:hypothetical protein
MPENTRTWIKVGPNPLRYEYGRENPDAGGAPIIDALAYVEQDRTGRFAWETYTDPHIKGTAPDREQAQAAALDALEDAGVIA